MHRGDANSCLGCSVAAADRHNSWISTCLISEPGTPETDSINHLTSNIIKSCFDCMDLNRMARMRKAYKDEQLQLDPQEPIGCYSHRKVDIMRQQDPHV